MISQEAIVERTKLASEAEFALLAALINSPDEIPEVRGSLRPEDFHSARNAAIFRALLAISDAGRLIDLVGIREWVRSSPHREDVPDTYLGELGTLSHRGIKPLDHAERIGRFSMERDLAFSASETLAELESHSGPAEEILQRSQTRLDSLASRAAGSESVGVDRCVEEFLVAYDERASGKRQNGLQTGLHQLDDLLCGGLPVPGMTILAARPSVGKTSFALQIIRRVCLAGKAVFFASLEQPRLELLERIIAAESGVNVKAIKEARLSRDERDSVSRANDQIREWRLRINDRSTQTAVQIAAAARQARKRMGSLDLVAVDYLGLIAPENLKVNRVEQVSQMTRRIRQLARDLNVPVLLLCQLNREAENEANHPPRLGHLRESGSIEQDADAVLFLHRTKERARNESDKLDLIIAKQRNGPIGKLSLEHHSHRFTFEEVVPQ